MYRGNPQPHVRNCRYCKGTGKIMDKTRSRVSHDCTSCNGTGIEGDPQALFLILIIWGILMLIVGITIFK